MLFGVTEIGPKLDAIVVALTSTLNKTGLNDADHEGGGFLDVQAAYDALVRQLGDPAAANTLWGRLTARAPEPAHVAEYRRLSAQIARDEESDATYLREIANLPDRVRDELLERRVEEDAPEYRAHRDALSALIAAHPDVEYEAAGAAGRAWRRWTGRGPRTP